MRVIVEFVMCIMTETRWVLECRERVRITDQ